MARVHTHTVENILFVAVTEAVSESGHQCGGCQCHSLYTEAALSPDTFHLQKQVQCQLHTLRISNLTGGEGGEGVTTDPMSVYPEKM